MPYVTQSRPHSKSRFRTNANKGDLKTLTLCYNTSTGVQNYSTPSAPVSADEQVFSYRTGRAVDKFVKSQPRLSGKDLRKLIMHDVHFSLSSDGSEVEVYETERERDYVAYPFDHGHNFRVFSPVAPYIPRKTWDLRTNNGNWRTRAPFALVRYSGDTPAFDSDLITWADTAQTTEMNNLANRLLPSMKPLAPKVDLARILGELTKDGFPTITGAILGQVRGPVQGVKGFASEYLNFQFGLAPTVSDFKKLFTVAIQHQALLNKCFADFAEIRIQSRKKRQLLTDQKSDSVECVLRYQPQNHAAPFSTFNSYMDSIFLPGVSASGTVFGQITSTFTKTFTMVTCWDMYLEDLAAFLDSSQSLLGRIQTLIDTKLDLSTAYDLVPWTWLANWFIDVGGFIRRAETLSDDRVALRYAYLMEEKQYSVSITPFSSVLTRFDGFIAPGQQVSNAYSKCRWRATPYGFGLNTSGWNAYRWSILAALGIARGTQLLRSEI